MLTPQTAPINRASRPTRKKAGVGYRLSRSFLLSLVLGLLITLDFVLYLRSGSVVLADGGLKMPVLLNIGYIFAVAAVLMFVSLVFLPLQNLFFALCCGLLAYGAMGQFLQVDKTHYLTMLLAPVLGDDVAMMIDGYGALILAGVVALISYLLVRKVSLHRLVSLTIMFAVVIALFFIIDLVGSHSKKTYSQVYESTETSFASGNNKTVFLFLPQAPAYPVISGESRNPVDKRAQLQQVELGFLVKNGFTVYPNAYATGHSNEENLVEFLNVFDNEPYAKNVLSTKYLENYWKFRSAQKPAALIKNNQLLDVFSKANFKTSAYQNQTLEICKKNGQYAVDRCLSRASLPLEIDSISFSDNEQAGVLLYQWLNSFDVLNYQQVADVLAMGLGRDEVKHLLMPYHHLYSVDSFSVLQNVLDDIAQDKSAGVYFVYLDFPDNMLVYNEWCRLKSPDRWNALNSTINLQAARGNSTDYNEQMLCLWGKMGDFMQNLASLDENVTLVLYGVGGVEQTSANKQFAEKFKNQNLVFMAIRDAQAQFSVQPQVCRSKDILAHHLFKAKDCKELKGIPLAQGAEEVLRNELKKSGIKKKMIASAVEGYEKWLSEWNINRQPPFLKANLTVQKENNQKNNASLKTDAAAQLLSSEAGEQSAPAWDIEDMEEDEPEEAAVPEDVVEEGSDVVPLEHLDTETKTEEVVPQESDSEVKADEKVSEEKDKEDIQDTPKEAIENTQQEEQAKELVLDDDFIPTAPDEEMVSDAELSRVVPAKNKPVSAPAKPKKVETFTVTTQPVVTVREVAPVTQKVIVNNVPLSEEAAPALNAALLQLPVEQAQTVPVVSGGSVEYIETTGEPTPVSGDFLIHEAQDEWQLDPAKAMGVSGDEESERKIIIQAQ